jgi:hypothetical protein
MMKQTSKHLSEDELTLHYYRESDTTAAQHLRDCPECAAEFARLEKVLGAVSESTLPVPARGEDYGRLVWAQVRERLPEKRQSAWSAWFVPQRLAWAGALAAVIVVAFLVGRISKDDSSKGPQIVEKQPEKVRERVVLVAVGQHLEKTQMVLVELVNTDAASGSIDISSEQERARDLLTANRLYRQTAQSVGDTNVASLLDELERTLVEIANSPADVSAARRASLQQQIESQGILFKMRVVGSKVKKEKNAGAAPPSGELQRL